MIISNKIIKSIILILCLVLLTSCGFVDSVFDGDKNNIGTEPDLSDENSSDQDESPKFPPPVTIELVAVGDVMVHEMQLRAQFDALSNEYNFENNFKYIKPYIQNADIALANLETTFAGADKKYQGYPIFNTPDSLADALKDTGFDIISTSNNHTFDTGIYGLLRTVEVLKDRNLGVIGTRKSEEEQSFIVKDVKGIKIGFSAYTYETPRNGENKTINGLVVPSQYGNLIDSFSYEYLQNDMLKIKERVGLMKQQGAEVVVFYMHWGNEYQRQPSSYQTNIAKTLADFGVDIILGSHPHVLQPIEYVQSSDGSRQTLVVYSMGNIISNQQYEYMDIRYSEDGIIVSINITKDFENNTISIENISYVPTWVHKYNANGKNVYEILPLLDALEDKEQYNLITSQSIWRAENSKYTTTTFMESEDTPVMAKPNLKELKLR
jgi:poly-gamma-glutamate capsule biosynthesis protein CapA/YwtB (metallophosphatase superfamily)